MSAARIAAVVLAGGEGKRLGASVPKPLVPMGGRPMIAHVLSRIPAFITPVLISANDEAAFAAFGHPVVPDRFADRRGPLAGLDAAATWLRLRDPAVTHLLSLPGDTPFLPRDLPARFAADPTDRPRLARFRGRLQPTVALWPTRLLDSLSAYLTATDDLSVTRFATGDGRDFEAVDIHPTDDAPSGDPFFNVNTPAELREASKFFVG